MKRKLQIFTLIAIAICFAQCDDNEKPKTVPVLGTAAVADITPTSAIGGGAVTSDGNAEITAMGLCWSSTSATPTINDDTTSVTTITESFSSLMKELTPSTSYNVRAYAINSVGAGYGETVIFMTGNAPPSVSNVAIAGTAEVNKNLTLTYTYSDLENDAEGGTTIKWYRAENDGGAGETVVDGATGATYRLQDADEFRFIRAGVIPAATTGSQLGVEIKSAYVGPIAVRSTVSFMYNGTEVTYGIITSQRTGRQWLDRNLGAANVATAYNDYANLGDLFQWGRGADGHQLLTHTPAPGSLTTGTVAAVNGTTAVLSSSDAPDHSLYITSTVTPFDWRSPSNDNLWKGPNGLNNPCPQGWHVPDSTELANEEILNIVDGYTKLKLTADGFRGNTGTFSTVGTRGSYWTRTIRASNGRPWRFDYAASTVTLGIGDVRSGARSCRCIKD